MKSYYRADVGFRTAYPCVVEQQAFNGTSGRRISYSTYTDKMVNWLGLLIPIAYLTVLLGSLGTFSHLYRARKAKKAATLEPWFQPHLQRNIYLSLIHMDPSDPSSVPAGSEKSLSKIPDSIIRAALLRRAVEDIHRIIQIRNAKPALQTLLQRGSVGEELWHRFQRAEQEIEEEVKDVVDEVHHDTVNCRFDSQANHVSGQCIIPELGTDHISIGK